MFRFCFAEKEVAIEKQSDGFDKVDEPELYFDDRHSCITLYCERLNVSNILHLND